jgi:bifunctional DNase/RNase
MATSRASKEKVSDSVAVDAKRILLRYGAPIAVLDKVSEVHRIEFAREIAKTSLADREPRLRELLAEKGYTPAKD